MRFLFTTDHFLIDFILVGYLKGYNVSIFNAKSKKIVKKKTQFNVNHSTLTWPRLWFSTVCSTASLTFKDFSAVN